MEPGTGMKFVIGEAIFRRFSWDANRLADQPTEPLPAEPVKRSGASGIERHQRGRNRGDHTRHNGANPRNLTLTQPAECSRQEAVAEVFRR
jgi:hypothetical protein